MLIFMAIAVIAVIVIVVAALTKPTIAISI